MKIKILFTDQAPDFDPEDNIYIRLLRQRYDVEFSEDPDFVFYCVFGTKFLSYPQSIKIFLANEPVFPNFNDCDYAIGAMSMSLDGRYFRQPPLMGFGENCVYTKLQEDRAWFPDAAFDRKFCNFIYSNASNGMGAKLRIDFCRRLSQYRAVDCPGRVLKNMDDAILPRYRTGAECSKGKMDRNWAPGKIGFLKKYKFTIAFENTQLPGFTTEKLFHPLLAGSIPIYWGNPMVTEYFSPKAFINCNDYGDDFDAVIRRVIELDHDKDQYMEMLRQPLLAEPFPGDGEDALADFLFGIVERGKAGFDKNPIGFETMSAQSLEALCQSGKMGLRKLAGEVCGGLRGWFYYKRHR